MSRTLVIPDELYVQLEATARQRGLGGIEELLQAWHAREEDRDKRQRAVERIDALRARLLTTYGEMPDSTTLLREERAR